MMYCMHLMHLIHLIHLMIHHTMIYLMHGRVRKPFDDASKTPTSIEVEMNHPIESCWFADLKMKCTCVYLSLRLFAKLIQFHLSTI